MHDRSAATDPTKVPAACEIRSHPGATSADPVQDSLTQAGLRANAHNFSRTFSMTLWYAVAILVVFFLGMFALPRRVKARDLAGELSALERAGAEADHEYAVR